MLIDNKRKFSRLWGRFSTDWVDMTTDTLSSPAAPSHIHEGSRVCSSSHVPFVNRLRWPLEHQALEGSLQSGSYRNPPGIARKRTMALIVRASDIRDP